MKVIALLVIFLLICRWTCSTPLPCSQNCGKDQHSEQTHLQVEKNDIERPKREFELNNLTSSVKRAVISVGKELNILNKREVAESTIDHHVSEQSNNSATNQTEKRSKRKVSALDDDYLIAPAHSSPPEVMECTKDKRGAVTINDKRDVPKRELNTTTTGVDYFPRIERQLYSDKNNTEGAEYNNTRNANTEVRRKTVQNTNDTQVQNTTIDGRQINTKNGTEENPNIVTSQRHAPDSEIDTKELKENFQRDISNNTESHNATEKVIHAAEKNTQNAHNKTQFIWQIAHQHQGLKTRMRESEKKFKSLDTTDDERHASASMGAQETKSTTEATRETSPQHYNHTPYYRNDTQEAQNAIRVEMDISYTTNNTKSQNTTIPLAQKPTSPQYLDHKDLKRQVSKTRHQNQQNLKTQVLETKNDTDPHNTTLTSNQENETQHAHEATKPQRQISSQYQYQKNFRRQVSDAENGTKVQNITITKRQISNKPESETQNAQDSKNVTRQTSDQYQDKQRFKRQIFDTRNGTEVQNTTMTKRQTSEYENDITRVSRQAMCQCHQRKCLKSKRQISDTNSYTEAQNITMTKEQTSNQQENDIYDAHNTTRARRQISYQYQNQKYFKRQVFDTDSDIDARNKTVAKRQTSDLQNSTQETKNVTGNRLASHQHESNTKNRQNVTRVKRQAHNPHQTNTKVVSNTTIDRKETVSSPQNETQDSQNTIKVKKQIIFQYPVQKRLKRETPNTTTQNSTNVTSVRKETQNLQNETQDPHSKTRMTRQISSNGTQGAENAEALMQTSYQFENDSKVEQNSTKNKRTCDNQDNEKDTQGTQNKTNVKRQIFHATTNTKMLKSEARAKRENSNYTNYSYEAQNTTKAKRKAGIIISIRPKRNPIELVNDTQDNADTGNTTEGFTIKVRRGTAASINDSDEVQSKAAIKRHLLYNKYTGEESQNKIFAKREYVDTRNYTTGFLNRTIVRRQTSAVNNSTEKDLNQTVAQTELLDIENDSEMIRKGEIMKRDVVDSETITDGDSTIVIRQKGIPQNDTTLNIKTTRYFFNFKYDEKDLTSATRTKELPNNFNIKYLTQIFIGIPKQNCTTQILDLKNYTKEELYPSKAENLNWIKNHSDEENRMGPRFTRQKNTEKDSDDKQERNVEGPKKDRVIIQENGGDIDNVDIQIQKYYDNDNGENHYVKREGNTVESSDQNTQGDNRILRDAEEGKNITVQIQEFLTDAEPRNSKRHAINTTANATELNSPKTKRYVFADKENSATHVDDQTVPRRRRQSSATAQNLTSTENKTEKYSESHHHGKRDLLTLQVFPRIIREASNSTNRSEIIDKAKNLGTQENNPQMADTPNRKKRFANFGEESMRYIRAPSVVQNATFNASDKANDTLAKQTQKKNASVPPLFGGDISDKVLRMSRSSDTEPKNVSASQKSGEMERRSAKNHSHIMKVPPRAPQANNTSSINVTVLRRRRWTSVESYSQNDESVPSHDQPVKYLTTHAIISFSALKGDNSTDESPIEFFEPDTTGDDREVIEKNEQSSSDDSSYKRYRFLMYDRPVDNKNDVIGTNEIGIRGFGRSDNNLSWKPALKIERIRCACAMYRPDISNQGNNPTFAVNNIDVPIGLNATEKELFCTQNCSEIAKIDVNIKQEVYCAHIKANKEEMKKIVATDQQGPLKITELVFCQVFTEENEPTLQFILSWLNVILLDVVVCLTGLGVVCMYLICFVSWRKRDKGPIYTPPFAAK